MLPVIIRRPFHLLHQQQLDQVSRSVQLSGQQFLTTATADPHMTAERPAPPLTTVIVLNTECEGTSHREHSSC